MSEKHPGPEGDPKPESETPEVDDHLTAFPMVSDNDVANLSAVRSFIALARSLERRLSLAQTEIKGHMRVVDELKATVASLERKLDDIVNTMKHAGMKVPGWIEHTDQDGRLRRDNLTIAATLVFELEAWQARIAELEKDAARYQTKKYIDCLKFMETSGYKTCEDTDSLLIAWNMSYDAAIDAALKSRA